MLGGKRDEHVLGMLVGTCLVRVHVASQSVILGVSGEQKEAGSGGGEEGIWGVCLRECHC